MNFTKQDLQKILDYIRKQSIADSEFPQTTSVSSTAEVPILSDGANKRVTVKQMADAAGKFMNLSNVPINIEKATAKNLKSLLEDLVSAANTGNKLESLNAVNHIYHYTDNGQDIHNVEQALNLIFSMIFKAYDPATASDTEINQIINS